MPGRHEARGAGGFYRQLAWLGAKLAATGLAAAVVVGAAGLAFTDVLPSAPPASSLPSPGPSAPVRSAPVAPSTAGASVAPATTPQAGTGEALRPVDAAGEAGIWEVTTSWDATVGDFDGDGRQDVLVGRHWQKTARLYRNEGGRFSEVAAGTFRQADRHVCAWGDVNQDGLPDLYCTHGATHGEEEGSNELWIQGPVGTFSDRASEWGVGDALGRGRETTFLDADGDPYPDLFVGNDFPRDDGRPTPNRLFLNEGGRSFRSAPEYGLDREVGGRCAQAIDWDRDGWQDLLVCGQDGLIFYQNQEGGTFLEAGAMLGIGGSDGWWSDALLVDVDRDGLLDLAQIRSRLFRIRLQGHGTLQPPGFQMQLEAGLRVAAGDADGDGWMDFYLLQGGQPDDRPDLLLLSEVGTDFVAMVVPPVPEGSGQDVAAIDYQGDGAMDFLVLNGRDELSGPVQLITLQR